VVLRLIALALVIIAAAGPQWDYEATELETSGLDIIFCVDISKSMDAEDIAPSRLSRAKLQISSFVDELQGDRIGIIAFAGTASLECPLTDDYESVQMVISSLSTNQAIRMGTDIGAALDLAAKSFNTGQGSKILILISDGEDLEKAALTKARRVRSEGVTIYTMGVGTESGTRITNPATGEEKLSVLDTATLSQIAKLGSGQYYSVSPGQNEIKLLLKEIYGIEKGFVDGRRVHRMKQQYGFFLIGALLFLLLEMLISSNRRYNKTVSQEEVSGY
ncbi:MAG TPA: VWA domain-containing protein, partial [Candidatus Cloacimonadota bacterium]|nr:VWA domain-containing protein [Candidatus Cloacimonadota bacterium]